MKTRRFYSLMEILLSMALGLALLGAAVQLLNRSWLFCRESVRQVHRTQELGLVRKRWRRFVRACPERGWTATDGTVFTAGSSSARADEGRIVLDDGKTPREIQLPEDAAARLSIERSDGAADRAVLTMTWAAPAMIGKRPCRARIVACAVTAPAE